MRATPAGAHQLAGRDSELARDGAPLLTDALASLECEIVAEHPAGAHWIVVAIPICVAVDARAGAS